jgi:peroxiredoxin
MNVSNKEIYSSAETVQPLLIGAEIPDVILTRIEGSTCRLAELVKSKPSIVVFYRGGW